MIAILLLLFIWALTLENRALAIFFQTWAVVPARLVTDFSAKFHTLFTATFIHGGWVHLINNLTFLWVFGSRFERKAGSLMLLLFFIISGSAANMMQTVVEPTALVPILGASGAIAGLIGATLAEPSEAQQTFILLAGLWLIFQFINGVSTLGGTQIQTGSTAFFAQTGGFVMGIFLVRIWRNSSIL